MSNERSVRPSHDGDLGYDANGNRASLANRTGTTSFAYDALNHVTSKSLPSAEVISYAYDGEGNLTSKSDAGGTISLA